MLRSTRGAPHRRQGLVGAIVGLADVANVARHEHRVGWWSLVFSAYHAAELTYSTPSLQSAAREFDPDVTR